MPREMHFFIDKFLLCFVIVGLSPSITPPSKAKRFGFSRFEMNTSQYGGNEDFFQRILLRLSESIWRSVRIDNFDQHF
jgi:hypothetical protein